MDTATRGIFCRDMSRAATFSIPNFSMTSTKVSENPLPLLSWGTQPFHHRASSQLVLSVVETVSVLESKQALGKHALLGQELGFDYPQEERVEHALGKRALPEVPLLNFPERQVPLLPLVCIYKLFSYPLLEVAAIPDSFLPRSCAILRYFGQMLCQLALPRKVSIVFFN